MTIGRVHTKLGSEQTNQEIHTSLELTPEAMYEKLNPESGPESAQWTE